MPSQAWSNNSIVISRYHYDRVLSVCIISLYVLIGAFVVKTEAAADVSYDYARVTG